MIIVTGGAGFIGSNLVKELNRLDCTDIVIIDDLKDGVNYKNLRGLKFRDFFHKDDFFDMVKSGSFNGLEVEAIFHEGACSDTMEYDVNYMMKTNYEYSKLLLSFAIKCRTPFFYASSASTYGAGTNGFIEGDECEDALNPYAFSKLAFDRYVRQIMPRAKSKVIGLKYFNVYGPQEHHKGKMASIFYQLYLQLKRDGVCRLFKGYDGYGDGEQRRDFIYVKDVVRVNLWLLKNDAPSGIYNLGTGQAHSYNEAASAVINALGYGRIIYVDFPEVLKGKYQSFTQADTTHLMSTGYDAGFTEFTAAVKEYIDFLEAGGYYKYVD